MSTALRRVDHKKIIISVKFDDLMSVTSSSKRSRVFMRGRSDTYMERKGKEELDRGMQAHERRTEVLTEEKELEGKRASRERKGVARSHKQHASFFPPKTSRKRVSIRLTQ